MVSHARGKYRVTRESSGFGMSDASGGRSVHVEGPDERENYKLVLNP